MSTALPYKISTLLFVKNRAGDFLLIERRKAPNEGKWSPIGGKLEMATGESPFQCAIREAKEEIGLELAESDLHLFGMIAEKAYEGSGHWLMFLFDVKKPLESLPPTIDEGRFGFFTREQIDTIPVPETDRTALWGLYDSHRAGFVAARADCRPGQPLQITVEESL